MGRYIKKSFSAHVYQDWIHLFKQCSVEERAELLLAITDYPNYEPKMDIAVWEFIKSQLDVQYQKSENKSRTMADNRNKGNQKSSSVDQSRLRSSEVVKCSQIEIETEIEKEIETGREIKNIPHPTEQEVLDYARQMDESVGVSGFECCPEQARLFFAYYDKVGWIDKGGVPIVDWKKSFKYWVRRDDIQKYQRGQKC